MKKKILIHNINIKLLLVSSFFGPTCSHYVFPPPYKVQPNNSQLTVFLIFCLQFVSYSCLPFFVQLIAISPHCSQIVLQFRILLYSVVRVFAQLIAVPPRYSKFAFAYIFAVLSSCSQFVFALLLTVCFCTIVRSLIRTFVCRFFSAVLAAVGSTAGKMGSWPGKNTL